MQVILVVIALLLYTAFSSMPIAALPIFSRTLNISPGDLFTILFVVGIFVKAIVQVPNRAVIGRPPAVIRFLYAYLCLAVVFLLPTLIFFLAHNELARYFGRSLLNYLLWSIALVLFYYSSDSRLNIKQLRLIACLLLGTFVLGTMANLLIANSGVDLLRLIADTFGSDQTRLRGQVGDPNQLGVLAGFFSTIGIMGTLYDGHLGAKLAFATMTVGSGLIMLLTQSREALLTVFIALLCMVVLLVRGQHYRKALFISLSLFLGSALILSTVPRAAETLAAVATGDTRYALSNREEVWRTAVDIISTQPLGIGFENMTYLTNDTISQAHNAFLQSAVIAGCVGFIVFLGFLLYLVGLLREQKKRIAGNWLLDAYFVFLVGYLATLLGSDHFISFYTFNAVFFGFLGFVACAR